MFDTLKHKGISFKPTNWFIQKRFFPNANTNY